MLTTTHSPSSSCCSPFCQGCGLRVKPTPTPASTSTATANVATSFATMLNKTIQRTMRCEAAAARNVQQANKFVNKCCQSKELQLQLKPSHSNSLSGRSHTHTHKEWTIQLCILCACRFVCLRCCYCCCCRCRHMATRRLFICRKLLLILPYTI